VNDAKKEDTVFHQKYYLIGINFFGEEISTNLTNQALEKSTEISIQ